MTRIAVYGATGFAGRLVAAETLRRGFDLLLAGRDHERLRAVANALDVPETDLRVAELTDHDALTAAFRDADAVINCATPFTLHGEPVVRAAIAAGAHYVDIAGEELYIKGVLDRYDDAARAAGVTVLPAANNDCLTGDLLGHLVADGLGELETISVAFDAVDAEGSRGTVEMAHLTADTMRSGGLTWHDGHYHADRPAVRDSVAWPAGPGPAVKFALPPAVTIPRHVRTRHAEGLATPRIHGFFAGADRALVDSMPPRQGPSEQSRARARYCLVIDARAVDGTECRAVLEARDMYGTTAVIAVEATRRLAAGPAFAGALAPAEVFDPADFLDHLRPHGLTWTIEPPIRHRIP
ncbi:saccharopine dehydrogenase family protein [Actinomadura kijaniata]|uniref:saccharopine dehydrogenase family protein n=1 Tax=Actinomadura kijaniata TaxID=46161 RepID=UPI0008302086|nr:saccharopine dehydrogenase NADP-binding domain-containing protein [Actinomadura kijaniata]